MNPTARSCSSSPMTTYNGFIDCVLPISNKIFVHSNQLYLLMHTRQCEVLHHQSPIQILKQHYLLFITVIRRQQVSCFNTGHTIAPLLTLRKLGLRIRLIARHLHSQDFISLRHSFHLLYGRPAHQRQMGMSKPTKMPIGKASIWSFSLVSWKEWSMIKQQWLALMHTVPSASTLVMPKLHMHSGLHMLSAEKVVHWSALLTTILTLIHVVAVHRKYISSTKDVSIVVDHDGQSSESNSLLPQFMFCRQAHSSAKQTHSCGH